MEILEFWFTIWLSTQYDIFWWCFIPETRQKVYLGISSFLYPSQNVSSILWKIFATPAVEYKTVEIRQNDSISQTFKSLGKQQRFSSNWDVFVLGLGGPKVHSFHSKMLSLTGR